MAGETEPTVQERRVYEDIAEASDGVIIDFIAQSAKSVGDGREQMSPRVVNRFVIRWADQAAAIYTGPTVSPFLHTPASTQDRMVASCLQGVVIIRSQPNSMEREEEFLREKKQNFKNQELDPNILDLPLRVLASFVSNVASGGTSSSDRSRR